MSKREKRQKQKLRRDEPAKPGLLYRLIDGVFYEFFFLATIILPSRYSELLSTCYFFTLISTTYLISVVPSYIFSDSTYLLIGLGSIGIANLLFWLRYCVDGQLESLKRRKKDRHPLIFLCVFGPLVGFLLWVHW